MDKKRILLLCAMGILLAAAIALGAVWIMEAAEYAGYKADYVDIAEDVLHSDEDDGMIELVPLSPAPMVTEVYAQILDEDRKVNAQKFESMFYANPDLRNVTPPPEPTGRLDLAGLIDQLQRSPELASALARIISMPADVGESSY